MGALTAGVPMGIPGQTAPATAVDAEAAPEKTSARTNNALKKGLFIRVLYLAGGQTSSQGLVDFLFDFFKRQAAFLKKSKITQSLEFFLHFLLDTAGDDDDLHRGV